MDVFDGKFLMGLFVGWAIAELRPRECDPTSATMRAANPDQLAGSARHLAQLNVGMGMAGSHVADRFFEQVGKHGARAVDNLPLWPQEPQRARNPSPQPVAVTKVYLPDDTDR